MATVTVRKFAISPDPGEALDFTEGVDYFVDLFRDIGFEQSGTYTFRYADAECMMKAELTPSKDGYFLWMYVQALDEHTYRLHEIADAFSAHLVEATRRK
jgi:hypothetical protein